MVGEHPTDESIRVVFHVKSNLSKRAQAVQFRLDDGVFDWAGKCDLTIEDVLYPNREAEQELLEKAKDFLLKAVASGPAETKDLKQQAAVLGISERTLERAKAALGLRARRVGTKGKIGSGHYEWYLNEADTTSSEELH
ncbi:MAG: hypothetical protein IPL83_15760 [Bdellovibrionales bacterium]|nr:hypothetical protein [Bdellovibrionales bacterium]